MRAFVFAAFITAALAGFSYPARGESCVAAARPVVKVTTVEDAAGFDTTRTRSELAALDIDTDSPWPEHFHTEVGGATRGEISIDHKIKFQHLTDVNTGDGCIHYKAVEVTLRVKPTIFVASEYSGDSCWFGEIFRHESKHVEADRELLRKYARQMTDAINMAFIAPADYATGFMPAENMAGMQKEMEDTVVFALGVMFEKMMRERQEVQQAVDSLAEYAHVSAQCPGA